MSAIIDTHGKKKVLMIVANLGTSPTTGWFVGFLVGGIDPPLLDLHRGGL
jgi:hypothetical protein